MPTLSLIRPHRRILSLTVLLPVLLLANSASAQSLPDLRDIFRSSFACLLIDPLLADMPVEQLFVSEGTACRSTMPLDDSLSYFLDDQCTQPLAFDSTSIGEFCDVLLDTSSLGEGQGIDDTPTWTLSPGSRLDAGARPLDGVVHPYLQRRIYRTLETARGTCELEMRVYAARPGGTGQRSLLAFHGGSWSARGFGFFGLEMSIPHYVEQGFVVYAPFYRLLGTSAGSEACNSASMSEIVSDASAALAWVGDNAAAYGSAAKPVVFGQSAGAHLAASLLVNEPASVSAGVLMYPPTDFTDFALRVQAGLYTNDQGLRILERILSADGNATNEVNINASPVPENSFPVRIVEGGLTVPPVLMIHGMEDELVEARQSLRMCDALAGRELMAVSTEVAALDTLRTITGCGADSELHLIREGEHALDVCLADSRFATDLCRSGSDVSRDEVSAAISRAATFAASHAAVADAAGGSDGSDSESDTDSDSNPDTSTDGEAAGGTPKKRSGSPSLWLLVLLLGSRLFRHGCCARIT